MKGKRKKRKEREQTNLIPMSLFVSAAGPPLKSFVEDDILE